MKNIGNTYNIYKTHYLKRKIKGINWKNDAKYTNDWNSYKKTFKIKISRRGEDVQNLF